MIDTTTLARGTCPTGKRRYESHTDAKRVLHKAKRNNQGQGRPVRAYRCGVCESWHLSSLAEGRI